ncbi:hypothetical protein VTN31DRAFT_488 [Thermomyces dupontii]|uniref:uncharacterized protein n=1 Tax=Talaromyces thermophilus TaxID=28565 RepID=UPI00374250B2
MLALRDQENLVHSHQTAAAAKNQGLRQLQPKTPGTRVPKTPFRVPLNDENDPLAFGKQTVKGNGGRNENTLKPVKDAFVTPMGPRNRAPLGNKTTNAKARALQTPAGKEGALKPKTNGKSSTTQNVKKAAPEVQPPQRQIVSKPQEEEVPDVEYAPPKPKDLPDDPDEIIYDTTFPQFQPQNIARGWEKVYYHGPVGEDGLTERERKFKEDSIAYDKMVDKMIQKEVDNMTLAGVNVREDPDTPCWEEMQQQRQKPAKETEKKTHTRNIPTVKSRDAAAALAQTSITTRARTNSTKTTSIKSSTAPKTRKVSSLLMPKKKTSTPADPPPTRHATAAASSRTTVGYAKGRNVSSILQGKQAPKKKTASQKATSADDNQSMSGLATTGRLQDIVVHEDDLALPIFEEDEETRNFQLTL